MVLPALVAPEMQITQGDFLVLRKLPHKEIILLEISGFKTFMGAQVSGQPRTGTSSGHVVLDREHTLVREKSLLREHFPRNTREEDRGLRTTRGLLLDLERHEVFF